jgi:uncharacterized protein
MRILIDIGHPAHVHLFRYTIQKLQEKGHIVIVSVKRIPAAISLLTHYNIPFIVSAEKNDSFLGKAVSQLAASITLIKIAKQYKIDLVVGSTVTAASLSLTANIPSIVLDDDDDKVEPLFVKYGHRFATVVLTPDAIVRKAEKTIYIQSFHEIAYLHPDWFKPDEKVLELLGVSKKEKYFILRFVAFKGHHDVGMYGLNIIQKRRLISLLEPYGKIFISEERKLDDEFEKYRIPIPFHQIHSVLYYASCFVGDSQTMTTEAALLGTPSYKCNTFSGILSVPNELEYKYNLSFSYKPEEFKDMVSDIKMLLNNPSLKHEWKEKATSFFKEKIDYTSFLIWFIENWPDSFRIMEENPGYQETFK